MNIIEIKEETKIPQENGSVVIPEAGDKIKVLKEAFKTVTFDIRDIAHQQAIVNALDKAGYSADGQDANMLYQLETAFKNA